MLCPPFAPTALGINSLPSCLYSECANAFGGGARPRASLNLAPPLPPCILSRKIYVRQGATKSQPRGDNALHQGFLGTAAPRYADLLLLLEIAMALALLVGALLARLRRFRAHAVCQSAIVLLNLCVIALVMLPSFRAHVAPRIPQKLGKAFYAFATVHAALGTIAESAALYILLAAGTNLLPRKLRITRYKLWMRAVLVVWWLVVLLGFVTYARWYLPHLFPR